MTAIKPPQGIHVTVEHGLDFSEKIRMERCFSRAEVSHNNMITAVLMVFGVLGLAAAFMSGWGGWGGWLALILIAYPLFMLLASPSTARRYVQSITSPAVLVEVTKTHLQLGGQRVAWGDIALIHASDSVLYLEMDGGKVLKFRLDYCEIDWLLAHLRVCLKQLAPGSPDDVPGALDDLLGGPD